jgi:serine/threonine-protein kinase RsbW
MGIDFDSALANIDHAASAVRDWCVAQNYAEDLIAQIELVLVEALTNVVVHGYSCREDQPIELRWWHEGASVFIEIRDRGYPIDELPSGDLPDPSAESGRGWYIIRALMDQVTYRRQGGQNILALSKSLMTG